MARKKKDNTAEIGFEQQIWSAADKLRGNIDASEYKNVVLGLIFLKYISDKFDQRHQELVDEGEGFEEDRDEYTAENIFFVPESARWKTIAAAAHTPEVGKVIDEAMRQIEAENDKLKNILPKNFARQELDKRRLGEVVDLFTNVQMAEKGDTRDILGRTYEYCLSTVSYTHLARGWASSCATSCPRPPACCAGRAPGARAARPRAARAWAASTRALSACSPPPRRCSLASASDSPPPCAPSWWRSPS